MIMKLLTILGIVLLLAVGATGVYTFTKRHQNKELSPSTSKTANIQPTKSSSQQLNKPVFDKNKYSLSDPTSLWVVVNKKRPLNPLQYIPSDLVTVGKSQQMRAEAAIALSSLITVAKTEGLNIEALSGYRSYTTQVTVYGNEVKNYGQTVADTESAKPGYSEHQTGWSVDVGGGGCGIEDCFGNTSEGKWLAIHAYEYGFIVRYTAAKQTVTGYRAEPWHIRYIGTELSNELHKQNVTTLEEFFNL